MFTFLSKRSILLLKLTMMVAVMGAQDSLFFFLFFSFRVDKNSTLITDRPPTHIRLVQLHKVRYALEPRSDRGSQTGRAESLGRTSLDRQGQGEREGKGCCVPRSEVDTLADTESNRSTDREREGRKGILLLGFGI